MTLDFLLPRLVTLTHTAHGQATGNIHLSRSPSRMDYAKITARLSYFAENLSRMFSKSQLPPLKEAAEADVPEAPEPVPPEE